MIQKIDRRLVDSAKNIISSSDTKVYKPTRAGFTTSAIIAAREHGQRMLVISPTNRILDQTVGDASDGNFVKVSANSQCIKLQREIDDRFIFQLPIPLPSSCDECSEYDICPITEILRLDRPIIGITYQKLEALLLSKSKIAKNILEKLAKVDFILLDEADQIALPPLLRVRAFHQIEIPDDFRSLSKVIERWSNLNDHNTNNIAKIKEEGDRGHVGKCLRKSIDNQEKLSFKLLVEAFNELFELAKRRKELGIGESQILMLRDIITLMGGNWLYLSYLKKSDDEEGEIFFTTNYWRNFILLREFLINYASRARHFYVSGTLFEPWPDFFSELSGKRMRDVIFEDFRNTNDKMIIYADTWRLSSRNFKKSLDRIIDSISEIIERHKGQPIYIVGPNARKAEIIRQKLESKFGSSKLLVDYYRSDKTVGVERGERICIAIGMAEVPSNAYDSLAGGNDDNTRWIDSQRLRNHSVQAASWQTWSRVKDPAGKEESRVYCIGVREDRIRDAVTWGVGRELRLIGTRSRRLPNGTVAQTPYFRAEVAEGIRPPKLAGGGLGEEGTQGERHTPADYIEQIGNYNEDCINFQLHDNLPIDIYRQNVPQVEIYNNPRNENELARTAAALSMIFQNRGDFHAKQNKQPDASGRFGWYKVRNSPGEDLELITDHLRGKETIGFYQIGLDDAVKWICYDVDDHSGERGAEVVRSDIGKLLGVLDKYGVPYLLEASGSPNSYHIWILLMPKKTVLAFNFSRLIATEAGVDCEIFPKQKKLTDKSKFGSQVKLPLGVNRKNGVLSRFLDPTTFEPYQGSVPIPGRVKLREIQEPTAIRKPRTQPGKRCSNFILPSPSSGGELRHCMQSLLKGKVPLESSEGHTMRVAIATEAWNIGMTPEQAACLFKDQRDFNPEVSRNNVEYIYSRGYSPYSCEKLQDECSSLVSLYCKSCPLFHQTPQSASG